MELNKRRTRKRGGGVEGGERVERMVRLKMKRKEKKKKKRKRTDWEKKKKIGNGRGTGDILLYYYSIIFILLS